MFESLQMAPPDPILGLTEAFQKDGNADKINLSVGVFKDTTGKTPVLQCVKQAEERILRDESTKSYKPITGAPEFGRDVQALLFGEDHEIVSSQRAATAHCPGGTGALRVVGNYLSTLFPGGTLWLSDPTWANHPQIFKHAGLQTKTYPYFDASTNGLDFSGLIDALEKVPAGDFVLLHGCCHNPTGVDPSPQQWAQIGALLNERGILPILDFAYQGFGTGIEEDAVGLRTLCELCPELIVCSSFSKNFGLYNERVGALTLVAANAEQAALANSQLKVSIRANYSNPPAHGGAIVTMVLGDDDLRSLWIQELADMRGRINDMRKLFVKTLAAKGVDRDFSFIESQNGMFSFSGLNKEQVGELRDKFSIYIVGSGRINVAGMTESNMDQLCSAIQSVL